MEGFLIRKSQTLSLSRPVSARQIGKILKESLLIWLGRIIGSRKDALGVRQRVGMRFLSTTSSRERNVISVVSLLKLICKDMWLPMSFWGRTSEGEKLGNWRDSRGNVGEGMYELHIPGEDCPTIEANEVLQCGWDSSESLGQTNRPKFGL